MEGYRGTPQDTTEFPNEVFSHYTFHYGEHLLAEDPELESALANSISLFLAFSTAAFISL